MGKDTLVKEILQKTESFYEFNIHSPAQYQRYGLTFINRPSAHNKDVTFALKLIKAPTNASAPVTVPEEDAALISTLDVSNSDLSHFMTESKF